MYIGGMGGTGKSQVLKAILNFFDDRHESHRVVVVAPTGSASALLGGSTYHYMFGIDDFSRENEGGRRTLSKICSRLEGVDYVFLDEVSMLSCKDMHVIGDRLCKVRNDLETPFGGMNMIFAGDFAQLPPAYGGESLALYSSSVGVRCSRPVDQMAALGKALWHQVTTVVILRQNMRMSSQQPGDAELREALANMRYKACTPANIVFLRSLVSGKKSKVTDPRFRTVSIITARNVHKDVINREGATRYALETGQKLRTFFSEDFVSSLVPSTGRRSKYARMRVRNALPENVQQALWHQPPSSTDSNIPGCVSLCIGMPVLIRGNAATELCITKGQEAVVHTWQERIGSQGQCMLETLFVELINPPSTVTLPGLPQNVVPLTPKTRTVKCALPDDTFITVSRTQVEVLPNFAMTDYTSQGKTRPFNVVDLNNSRTHQAYYTALSRSSSANGTLILQGFDCSKIVGGCSGALRQEFCELELLDDIVRLRYNGDLPSGVYGDRRNTLIESFRKTMGPSYVPSSVHNSISWTKDDPFQHIDDSPYCWNHQFVTAKDNKLAVDTLQDVSSLSSAPSQRGASVRLNPLKRSVGRGYDATESSRVAAGPPSVANGLMNIIPLGPVWTENSCAYDCVVTPFFNLWQENPNLWHGHFSTMNASIKQMSTTLLSGPMSVQQIDVVRDGLRLSLAAEHPVRYAHGRYVSAADIVSRLLNYSSPVCQSSVVCANGHAHGRLQYSQTNVSLISVAEDFTGSLQDWPTASRTRARSCCSVCSAPFFHVSSFLRPIPIIAFELVTTDGVDICRSIEVTVYRSSESVSYNLFGVLYFANSHYTYPHRVAFGFMMV